MIKHWRHERGQHLLTGTMSRMGSGKTWIVADVLLENIEPGEKIPEGHVEYVLERQRLINEELYRLAASAMELSLNEVRQAKLEEPVEGLSPGLFHLSQHVSETGSHGQNVLFIGDTVANGHWSVGGGMQIGMISHGQRLKKLLLELDLNRIPKIEAIREYGIGVVNDSIAWLIRGIHDFYPTICEENIFNCFKVCMEQWQKDPSISPHQRLESVLSTNNFSCCKSVNSCF
ncbi:unnamed protein product [Rotaria sp. Silwood2]|nr:unnamed protein product [Rotaria sp. Silwood2]CAF4648432.1 unnamed protein product [Rotaria sp. Silwood2]